MEDLKGEKEEFYANLSKTYSAESGQLRGSCAP